VAQGLPHPECSPEDAQAELGRLLEAGRRRRRFPGPDRPILIYGAGNRGREVLAILRRHGYHVVGFADRAAKPGQRVESLPCHAPDDPEPLRLHREGAEIVVAIYRHDLHLGEIVASLAALGFQEPWTMVDLYERFGKELSETYWLSTVEELSAQESQMREALGLLDDAPARRVFLDCLRLRLPGDVSVMSRPDLDHHYFPSDVWRPREGLRMADCGAFTGDSYRDLRKAGFGFEALAAFEPDPRNFARLVDSFRDDSDAPEELLLLPCGVWSDSRLLSFHAAGYDGSRVDEGGSSSIQTVAIDEVLPRFRPNFIKMDVEGAEPHALDGARRSISANRPVLAVASYHAPEHLWSLLLKVARWDLGYRFRMRYHWFNDFEIVLYALPPG
jgi:FkbM family methyltransferase